MDELNEILKPSWGTEKWILEGFNKLTRVEKDFIKGRIDDLFKDGLPFELVHDKLLYIYIFSLCAQIECIGIQVPLRFEDQMTTPQLKEQMHRQLLDEIFHAMLFTKLLYMLSAPAAFPPDFSSKIEDCCRVVTSEKCPKMASVMMNLVFEGWGETLFQCLYDNQIAPEVMSIVLEDEHRHVHEADLYRINGLPDEKILRQKLEALEQMMLTCFLHDPKYMMAINGLLGSQGIKGFFQVLGKKHVSQLKKINMVPSKHWQLQMEVAPAFYTQIVAPDNHEIELTPLRKVLMTQWNATGDPTMVGQYNIDVSCLNFFEKKFSSDTLTTLMLQTTSLLFMDNNSFRTHLSFKKIYQNDNAYVSIAVKLPGCQDHLGAIVFKNCHLMDTNELSIKIRQLLEMMVYCYKKREELDLAYPNLKSEIDNLYEDMAYGAYPFPFAGNPIVSVSGIGFCGYSQAISPMRKDESVKFTLLTVERKPVWDQEKQSFEPRDLLPVSMSGDHRVFDGHIPMPKLMNDSFQKVFQQMLANKSSQTSTPKENIKNKQFNHYFKAKIEETLSINLAFGYQMLTMLQTMWPAYFDAKALFGKEDSDHAQQHSALATA
jgi:hypothetical protein